MNNNPADPKKTVHELTVAAIGGDAEAFNCLVDRYFEMVYLKAYSSLWDHQAAEDLTQEAFLRAYLAIKNLRNPKCFPVWLNRITRNLTNDWIKRGQRTSKMVPLVTRAGRSIEIKDTTQKGIHEMIEENEQTKMIHEAIEKLSPELMEIVLMRFMRNLKIAEIAGLMGIGTWVVRYKLKKALRQLKVSLEPVLIRESGGFGPDRKSVARTVAIITAAAALSADTKSSIAAAGGAAQKAAVSLAKSGSISGLSGFADFLKAVPAYLTAGGAIVGIKQGVAVAVIAVLFLGGAGYYYQQRSVKTSNENWQTAEDVFRKAETVYAFLAAAVEEKDWKTVDDAGNNLANLFRDEVNKPFYAYKEVQMKNRDGKLTAEDKKYLDGQLKKRDGILSHFDKNVDLVELRRVFSEIEEYGDETHDLARDGEYDQISAKFSQLEKSWSRLNDLMD